MSFLEKALVKQTGWLNGREFLVAVAIGMISPGPVVITATLRHWAVGCSYRAATGGNIRFELLAISDTRRVPEQLRASNL